MNKSQKRGTSWIGRRRANRRCHGLQEGEEPKDSGNYVLVEQIPAPEAHRATGWSLKV